MPTTEPTYGWRLPDQSDTPDGPTQMANLAADIAATFDTDVANPGSLGWLWTDERTWNFVNGTIEVTFGSTTPAGWQWAEPPTAFAHLRSNALPAPWWVFAVGNVTTTGCTLHAANAATGEPRHGTIAVFFSIAGRITRIP